MKVHLRLREMKVLRFERLFGPGPHFDQLRKLNAAKKRGSIPWGTETVSPRLNRVKSIG